MAELLRLGTAARRKLALAGSIRLHGQWAFPKLWCGFGVALVWLWWSLGGALGWLWGRIGVALGWLCTPKQMALWWPCGGFVLRSLCLVYAYHMALGWLWVACRPFLWTLDVRCPMFRTANRPGSQRVGMGLGVVHSGAFLPSWPLRTGTVRGPIQSLMQPCPAGSQAGIRLVFPRRGITCR
jgi:hypothetical protein